MSQHEALSELDKIESNFKLRDPQTAPRELRRIVAEELGKRGIRTEQQDDEAIRAQIRSAAAKFMAARPESDSVNGYLPTADNEKIVLAYMEKHGLDPRSAFNFEEAFLAVRDRLTPPKQKPTRSAVRKVGGIEVTHESLDRMSAEEMGRRMQDPRFVAAVNALPPRTR